MTASTQYHPLAQSGGFAYSVDSANEIACLRAKVTLPADFEAGDKYVLFKLPAEHRIIDASIAWGDIEASTAAATFDVGIVDTVQSPSDTTDLDAIFDGVTVGTAAGFARMTLPTALNVAPVNYDRYVQLLIATGATTPASGDVEVLVWVSPKQANSADNAVVMAT
jgi:hypothetical protein